MKIESKQNNKLESCSQLSYIIEIQQMSMKQVRQSNKIALLVGKKITCLLYTSDAADE